MPVVLIDDSKITSPVTDIEERVVPLVVFNEVLAEIVGELPVAGRPAIKVPLKAIVPVSYYFPER